MSTKEMNLSKKEQEEEINKILIDSSLYREMSQHDRQDLLQYLAESFFKPKFGNNNRALPKSV